MARQIITYEPTDCPDAEVLVDDAWHPAEVRQWVQRDDGTWWANCAYHPPSEHGGRDTHLQNFPADHVREDTVDRRPAHLREG